MNQFNIVKAFKISAKAHNEQLRKCTDLPYIVHPFEVFLILNENGVKEEVLIAGILHDTLEDTKLTKEDIEREFGKEVLELVIGSSEELEDRDNKSWYERKAHTVEFLKTASKEIKQIACADKLSNLRSMIEDYKIHGEKLWDRFNNNNKLDHRNYYLGILNSLEELKDTSMYEEFKRSIENFFIV